MATHEVVTRPARDEADPQPAELPEGWIERALAQASRLGRPDAPTPVASKPDPAEQQGEIAWRYVNGRRVHPSWPPGYIEWLDEMRETGELEIGDPDELRRAFNDPRPG